MTAVHESSAAVGQFVAARGNPPWLLALGEPTHGEPAFPLLRNRIFGLLVDHGFRSIAIESDRVAAFRVDAYVRGEGGTLDAVLADGFSHGFGGLDANRALVSWMRAVNESRPPADRLSFHGFDAPLEMTGAPSPRRYLEHVHRYLTALLGADGDLPADAEVARLLGDDERWSDPAAVMDAARSVGGSPEAAALRVVTDDLLTILDVHAPRLVAASSLAEWRRAEAHATAARGLLRYHAAAARPAPAAERTSRMLGVRDAWMARNLLDIRAVEEDRGATLVFGHNSHVQRHPATWRLAGMDLAWASAGSIVASLLGERYAVITSSVGAGPALHPLEPDATTVRNSDAVLHVAAGPIAAELAERILALPGVTQLVADEESGAPQISWGDRFFYVGPDRRRPFATIVDHDVPGFDEDSRLDRVGIFRLNIELGRDAFQRRFGYPPRELADHRAGVDFTALDEIFPHPAYGTHGWASILNPGPARLPEVDRLLADAHRRATDRAARHRQPRQ